MTETDYYPHKQA
jgi:hypothetical protein